MPRTAKSLVFGVFDEQAVSVLFVIGRKALRFGEIIRKTGLSKASLYRVLRRLEDDDLVWKAANGYRLSSMSDQILRLVERLASQQTSITARKVQQRLREMEREYRREGRLFHHDKLWERTAEKPLAEVMAVRHMTELESLLLHQKFQEEVRNEDRALRRASSVKR